MAHSPGHARTNQAPAQVSLREQRRLVQEGWDAVCTLLQAASPSWPLDLAQPNAAYWPCAL